MVYVLGSDLSHWNFNQIRQKLQALWDEGYRFVWIKVSEGTGFEDPNWQEIKAIAEEIGFLTGPYHYFLPTISGIAQGGHFFSVARKAEWVLKPVLDVEEPGHYAWTGTKTIYGARVKGCLGEIHDLFEKRALVYTSKNKWDTYVDVYVEEELFVAHWTSRLTPLIPRKWEGRGWTVWQFMVKTVDRDRFKGSWEEFLRWVGMAPNPGDLEEQIFELQQEVAAQKRQLEVISKWIRSYPS